MLSLVKLSAGANAPANRCTFVQAIALVLALCLPLPSIAAESIADPLFSEFQSTDEAEMISVIVTLHDADSEIRQLSENARGKSQKKPAVLERQAQRRGALARHQDKTLTRLQKRDFKLAHKYSELPFLSLKVNRMGLSTLLEEPDVSVSKVKYFRPLLDSSVPLIMDEVGTYDPTVDHNRGAGWAVAILDTGIESSHSFLGGRVVEEACYSTKLGTIDPLCPGGISPSTAVGSGEPCSIDPYCSHGTMMAGIVAGDGTIANSIAYDGVATAADLVSIKVFSYDNTPGNIGLFATTPDILAGMNRVLELSNNGTMIASVLLAIGNSVESENCDATAIGFKIAIDNLKAAGIATVASAGNNAHTDGFNEPACVTTAISVGASDDTDEKWVSSNEGNGLDLYAPGVSITSSSPVGVSDTGTGTSFSAAHVAGAWAVLKQASPHATVDQITAVLKASEKNVTGNTPSGAKRIDLNAALGIEIPDFTASLMFPVKSKSGKVFVISL